MNEVVIKRLLVLAILFSIADCKENHFVLNGFCCLGISKDSEQNVARYSILEYCCNPEIAGS